MKKFDLSVLIPALALVGGALRLAGIFSASIWYDEAFSLALIRFDPLTMIKLASYDFNPPLWEMVAWPFVRVFGNAGLRVPAVLFGLLTIWLAWRLMQRFEFSTVEQIAAMVLIAFLPGLLWMSQDGRTYAMFTALYLAAVWFAVERRGVGLAACIGFLCYCHNAGPFYAMTLIAVYAIRAGWRHAAIVAIAAGLSFAPWIGPYLNSAKMNFWLGPLTWQSFLTAIVQSWFTTQLPSVWLSFIAGWVVLACVGIAVMLSLSECKSHNIRDLLIVAAGPLLVMIVCSATIRNVIFYRPLMPMVIPLVLLIAKSMTPNRISKTSWFIPTVWAVFLALAVVNWSPAIRGGGLRDQADFIRANWQPGDVIYYGAGTALPFQHYLDLPAYLIDEDQPEALLQKTLSDAFGLQRAGLETIPHNRVWIIWPRDPVMTPPAQARMAEYTKGAQWIGRVAYLQAAPIDIYLAGK